MNPQAQLDAVLADNIRLAPLREVARHLARVALYQWHGADALYPDVKEKFVALVAQAQALGMPIHLQEGFRPASFQDGYYAKGRTTAGSIITNAKGLQSYHQFGLAFDVVFDTYGYNPPDANWWTLIGIEGEKLGLTWGGRWTGFADRPHFEWHPNFVWKDLEAFFKV